MTGRKGTFSASGLSTMCMVRFVMRTPSSLISVEAVVVIVGELRDIINGWDEFAKSWEIKYDLVSIYFIFLSFFSTYTHIISDRLKTIDMSLELGQLSDDCNYARSFLDRKGNTLRVCV